MDPDGFLSHPFEPRRVTSNDLVGALGAIPAAWLATVSRRGHSVDVFQRGRFLFPRQPLTSPLPKSQFDATTGRLSQGSFIIIITRLITPASRLNGLKPYGSDPASGVPPAPNGPTPVGWGVAEAAWLAAGSNGQRLDMGYLNGKKLNAVKGEVRGKHDRERFIEPELVELHLDRVFLQADGGEEPGIGRVFDRRPGRCAQPGVVGEEPKKGVGIEQELHSMDSRNPSSGSSKSSDIQILPLRLPALG